MKILKETWIGKEPSLGYMTLFCTKVNHFPNQNSSK